MDLVRNEVDLVPLACKDASVRRHVSCKLVNQIKMEVLNDKNENKYMLRLANALENLFYDINKRILHELSHHMKFIKRTFCEFNKI